MPFERELAGGEMHTYRLTLNGGQFIRAVFDQRGIDIEVALLDAGGRELLRVNNPVGVWGPEPVFFEVARGGQYTLVVRTARASAPPGRYVMTIDTRSARDAGDVESLPADRVFAEGTALLASRTTGNAYIRALEKYREALRLFRAVDDRRGEITTLVTIGSVAAALGEQQNALANFNEALPLLRAVNDRAGEAAAFSSIAQIYFALGNKERALENFGSALRLFNAVEDKRTAAYTLANIGLTHVAMTERRKGLDAFQEALALLRAVEDRRGQAFALNHIALIHSSLGDDAEARRYHKEVLVLVQQINDCAEIAPALSNLAWDSLETGDKQKAIDYLNQALALQKTCSHDRCGQATTLNNLGFVYYTIGDRQKSLAHLRQALALFIELEDREGEGDASSNLMYVLRGSGQTGAAIFFGKRAINAYQAGRASLPPQDLMAQRSFIKSKETTYRELADLLVTQSRLLEAQQVLGLLKEQEYLDYVRRSGDDVAVAQKKAALTPAESNAEKAQDELAGQLTMRGRERGTLLAKQGRTPEEEQRLAALDTELQASGQAFQTFLDRLGEELGNTKQAARVDDLRDSQALMDDLRELGAGSVALYTILGAEKYRVILVTPDVQKAAEYTIKAADLERKILAFREVLQNPRQDARPLAAELYKILVAPIAQDLQGAQAETLMWSLDGALRYLPVAALYDGERYMVERYRNVVFTPASNSRLKDQPSAKWSGLGLGVSKAQMGFSALPGVPEELRGIISDSAMPDGGVLDGKVILDDAFTEESFRAALRQRFPVVHIASHFAVQPGNETDSFLLLGDGSHLSLAKIKSAVNLFGGVELLTLSACDTATGGTAADGKEVESFAVLAQRQGAKAVMASLWPVADASTKQLMQSFYRIRNSQTGMLKAEALRRAQVSLLRGEATELVGGIERRGLLTSSAQRSGEASATSGIGKTTFAHPFFWAPFILIGNWR